MTKTVSSKTKRKMNEIQKNKNGNRHEFRNPVLSYRYETIIKTFVYWDTQMISQVPIARSSDVKILLPAQILVLTSETSPAGQLDAA